MDINALIGQMGNYGELVLALIGVCAAVAALLPAPGEKDGKVYRAIYTGLNFLAVNFGHARNATAPKAENKPQA
ncbi:MAG: hypothetical protein J5828_01495 [Desulfovibrionaceae bacterium]|nr:hypothetical protein [Desulfovibrionaceae bacterium]